MRGFIMGECCGYCSRCKGMSTIVLGVLVWLNIVWWSWDWWKLVGTLLLVGGLVRVFKPSCGCCEEGTCMPKKAEKKTKK